MSTYKHLRTPLAACATALLLAACGGGEAPSGQAGAASENAAVRALSASDTSAAAAANAAQPQPTPVGEPISDISGGRIGPAGGTLTTPDETLTLIVPPGALDREVDITFQRITNRAHGAKGGAWRIGPESLQAVLPMTLRFHLGDDDLAGTVPHAMSIATQDSAGYWQVHRRPQLDLQARTLTVQTKHLSDWSLVAGVQLTPRVASVLAGGTVDLSILDCPAPASRRSDEWGTALPCVAEDSLLGQADHWAVGGVEGGTPVNGTIVRRMATTSESFDARYTAPVTPPPGRWVEVSVDYRPLSPNAPTYPLSARIEVLPAEGCNWLHTQTALRFQASMAYAWSGSNASGTLSLDQRGNISGVMQRVYDNDFYGLWTATTTTGRVDLDDSHAHDSEVNRLFGHGAPAVGSGIDAENYSGMQVLVDYRTCTYSVGVNMAVLARTGAVPDTPRVVTAGGFSRSEAPIGNGTVLRGETTMPPRPEPDPAGTYYPGGMEAGRLFIDGFALPGQAGQAQVSWRVEPAH